MCQAHEDVKKNKALGCKESKSIRCLQVGIGTVYTFHIRLPALARVRPLDTPLPRGDTGEAGVPGSGIKAGAVGTGEAPTAGARRNTRAGFSL